MGSPQNHHDGFSLKHSGGVWDWRPWSFKASVEPPRCKFLLGNLRRWKGSGYNPQWDFFCMYFFKCMSNILRLHVWPVFWGREITKRFLLRLHSTWTFLTQLTSRDDIKLNFSMEAWHIHCMRRPNTAHQQLSLRTEQMTRSVTVSDTEVGVMKRQIKHDQTGLQLICDDLKFLIIHFFKLQWKKMF